MFVFWFLEVCREIVCFLLFILEGDFYLLNFIVIYRGFNWVFDVYMVIFMCICVCISKNYFIWGVFNDSKEDK